MLKTVLLGSILIGVIMAFVLPSISFAQLDDDAITAIQIEQQRHRIINGSFVVEKQLVDVQVTKSPDGPTGQVSPITQQPWHIENGYDSKILPLLQKEIEHKKINCTLEEENFDNCPPLYKNSDGQDIFSIIIGMPVTPMWTDGWGTKAPTPEQTRQILDTINEKHRLHQQSIIDLLNSNNQYVVSQLFGLNIIHANVTLNILLQLQQHDDIDYIDSGNHHFSLSLFESRQLTGVAHSKYQGYNGSNTIIGIIDSGLDIADGTYDPINHTAVPQHVDLNDLDDSDATIDPKLNKIFVFPAPSYNGPDDNCNGHGTAVAGIAAGTGQGRAEYSGYATNARLNIYDVLDCNGYGDFASIASAIDMAIIDDVDVINLSLGSIFYNPTNSLKIAYDAGIPIVAASGNRGNWQYYNTTNWPAIDGHVLAVGATSQVNLDERMFYSSKGVRHADDIIKPDLVAPVDTIPGIFNGMTAPARGINNYDAATGTSFAAPQVAGAIAILIEKYAIQKQTLLPGQLYAVMLSQALGTETGPDGIRMNNEIGAGALNLRENTLDTTSGFFEFNHSINKVNIPIDVPPNIEKMTVALWWPQVDFRNSVKNADFDLKIFHDNNVVASSTYDKSATQRIIIDNPIAGGNAYTASILPSGIDVGEKQRIFFAYTFTSPNTIPIVDQQTINIATTNATEIIITGTDPDRDIIGFYLSRQPTNGTITPSSNSNDYLPYVTDQSAKLNYTARTNVPGTDSFQVIPWDGMDTGIPVTININLFPDVDPPHIGDMPPIVVEAESRNGSIVNYIPPHATDNKDLHVPVICNPPPGHTFPLGVTNVICSATDAAGNSNRTTFTITVQDTTPPTIIPLMDIILEATGPTGTTITLMQLGMPRASDLVDPNPVITNNVTSLTFPLGTTYIRWTATDNSGNAANATQLVVVHDPIAVNLTLVPDHASTFIGRPVNIPVLHNDYGITSNKISINSVITDDTNGTVSINRNNNTITFTPSPGFAGTTSFEYDVSFTYNRITTVLDPVTVTVNVRDTQLVGTLLWEYTAPRTTHDRIFGHTLEVLHDDNIVIVSPAPRSDGKSFIALDTTTGEPVETHINLPFRITPISIHNDLLFVGDRLSEISIRGNDDSISPAVKGVLQQYDINTDDGNSLAAVTGYEDIPTNVNSNITSNIATSITLIPNVHTGTINMVDSITNNTVFEIQHSFVYDPITQSYSKLPISTFDSSRHAAGSGGEITNNNNNNNTYSTNGPRGSATLNDPSDGHDQTQQHFAPPPSLHIDSDNLIRLYDGITNDTIVSFMLSTDDTNQSKQQNPDTQVAGDADYTIPQFILFQNNITGSSHVYTADTGALALSYQPPPPGVVHIYNAITGTPISTRPIHSPDAARNDQFGASIDTLPNGNLLVGSWLTTHPISNIRSGAAYIIHPDTRTVLHSLYGPDENLRFFNQFGRSVSSFGDNYLLIGVPRDDGMHDSIFTDVGAFHIYNALTGDHIAYVPADSHPLYATHGGVHFGSSVSGSPDGSILASRSQFARHPIMLYHFDGINITPLKMLDGTGSGYTNDKSMAVLDDVIILAYYEPNSHTPGVIRGYSTGTIPTDPTEHDSANADKLFIYSTFEESFDGWIALPPQGGNTTHRVKLDSTNDPNSPSIRISGTGAFTLKGIAKTVDISQVDRTKPLHLSFDWKARFDAGFSSNNAVHLAIYGINPVTDDNDVRGSTTATEATSKTLLYKQQLPTTATRISDWATYQRNIANIASLYNSIEIQLLMTSSYKNTHLPHYGWFDNILLYSADHMNTPPTSNNREYSIKNTGSPTPITLTANDPDTTNLKFIVTKPPTNGVLGHIYKISNTPNTVAVPYTPNPGFSGSDSFEFKATDGLFDTPTYTAKIFTRLPNQPTPPTLLHDDSTRPIDNWSKYSVTLDGRNNEHRIYDSYKIYSDLSSGHPSPPSITISGSGYYVNTGIKTDIDTTSVDGSYPVYLSFDWRARSPTIHSTQTNAFVYLYSTATGQTLLWERLARGGIIDTGWSHYQKEISDLLSGHRSVTLVFYFIDAWAYTDGQRNWYDNIYLGPSPPTPTLPITGSAEANAKRIVDAQDLIAVMGSSENNATITYNIPQD